MDKVEVKTVWFEDFKKALPKVDGKVFVISGTTSGTGYAAAKATAELGGEVLLLNRLSDRSTKSLAKLQEEVPNGKFVAIECDLQSFASVKAAAEKILAEYSSKSISGNKGTGVAESRTTTST